MQPPRCLVAPGLRLASLWRIPRASGGPARPLNHGAAMSKSSLGFALALALGATACQISPVVTDPSPPHDDRYSQCREAARDYCRKVVGVAADELDRCVAEHAFRCVSGGR